jgi:hypothetical protein
MAKNDLLILVSTSSSFADNADVDVATKDLGTMNLVRVSNALSFFKKSAN